MAEKNVDVKGGGASTLSGQEARRNFLKKSGRVAIAAPAAVLLLAAANKSAIAQAYGGDTATDDVLVRDV